MPLLLSVVLLGHLALGPPPIVPAAVLTGKERLTDKGSDEQRVDDCKVPKKERTRPRPTSCSHDVKR